MKMISKTDLLDKLKAYIKTPDNDTIRYKKKIEKMLMCCPELLYALNEKKLESELFDENGNLKWDAETGEPLGEWDNRSKYEEFIHDYLSSLHIYFEEEKRFSDCRNSKGSDMLPFDFYIPEQNILIEYDGQHHFEPIKGWGGEEKFKLTQENDQIKNKYCEEKNIKLLRIPYTDSKEDIINKINYFMSPVTITA